MQDLRYALAQLRRAPAFAAAVILTLALAIGANTAIVAVQHLIIAPVPYEDANRVALVLRTMPATAGETEPTRDVVDAVRARADVFESAAYYARASFTLNEESGPEQLDGAQIAPDLLKTVGMHPLLGRGFTADDTLPGAPGVALISYGLWQSRFAGARDVLGRIIRIDDQPTSVVGVLPFGFTLPWTNGDQFWMPLRSSGAHATTDMIVRLRTGVPVERASREVKQIVESFEPRSSNPRVALGTMVLPVADFYGEVWRKSGFRTALLVLLAAVGLVLLIACVNVANLVLARAWARQREFAIRAALGARRARLVRLVLAESLVLAIIGGVVGMLIGWRTVQLIIDLHPRMLSELTGVHIDAVVLGIIVLLTTASGFAFGLVPALFASNARVALALNSQSRAATGGGAARRFRSALVMAEVALSVVLLVSGSLLVRSMVALGRVDIGVNPRGLAALTLSFPNEKFHDAAARATAEARILDVSKHLQGVRGAALGLTLPPSAAYWAGGDIQIEGQAPTAAEMHPVFGVNVVTPEFFATVGLRLKAGRVFDVAPNETNPHRPTEVVVSETFARQHWPHGGALGGRFHGNPNVAWMTVVGIVGDVQLPQIQAGVGRAHVYTPMPYGFPSPRLIVQSDEPLASLARRLLPAIAAADPAVRVRRTMTVESMLADATAVPRFMTTLFVTFAALALGLATVGLYSVIAISMRQRVRELGIRLALGAQGRDIITMVLRDGLRLAGVGLALGIIASFAATRAIRSQLFGVGAADASSFVLVGALVIATAALAAYLPARSAARGDPLEALRSE